MQHAIQLEPGIRTALIQDMRIINEMIDRVGEERFNQIIETIAADRFGREEARSASINRVNAIAETLTGASGVLETA